MDHLLGLVYSQEETGTVSAWRSRWSEALSPQEVSAISSLSAWTTAHEVAWTIYGEPDFPTKLQGVISKPYIIYYQWDLSLLERPLLWIVGPRSHSAYAKHVLEHLFDQSKAYQFCTISGLAPGVDQLCHQLSLQHHIPTIAVLGSGLKRYRENENQAWIDRIVEAWGLVISEFKLDQVPQTYTYPQRNRIIAWCADVIFLPEAGIKSGSLITAEYGLQMHKPVYGVPNSIFSSPSAWLNDYIAQGKITMATSCTSLLEKYFSPQQEISYNPRPISLLTDQEEKIFHIIAQQESCAIAHIIEQYKCSSQEAITLLSFLEMKKYIYQEIPWVYKVVSSK